MIANGIINSHILYHIQLFGGSSEELLSALQLQQNKAARLVCRLPWRTRTETLLQQMGWMNVKQMVAYHSVLSLYKIRKARKPKYIHEMISEPFPFKTRIAKTGGIRDTRGFTSRIGQTSFIPRTIDIWNSLPSSIRQGESPGVFSILLKKWVKNN